MNYVNEKNSKLLEGLYYRFSNRYEREKGRLYVRMVPLEADEMWTFVKKCWNKVWLSVSLRES